MAVPDGTELRQTFWHSSRYWTSGLSAQYLTKNIGYCRAIRPA